MLYLLPVLGGHPIAVQCLSFFGIFNCIKRPPWTETKPHVFFCDILLCLDVIHHRYKEMTWKKLLKADNWPFSIVNAFQMSAMC